MQVIIKSLNVKDGDAIIVNLIKSTSNLLFLIDGGHSSDSQAIIKNLYPFLLSTGKQAPDFILCTHYDDDHIGGLFNVVRHYGNKINNIWIHKTSEKYETHLFSDHKTTICNSIFPNEENDYLVEKGINPIKSDPYYENALKSLKQEIEFIELLNALKIPITEPISDRFYVEGWPELSLIGPSKEYYESLFPAHFNTINYIKDEMEYLKAEINDANRELAIDYLDNVQKSGVTPPNLNSAILLLCADYHKFLFTGDAGIPSFKAIKNYELLLKDIFWIKIPHHASKNNINTELINLFNPKHALISGDRHISYLVSSYLKNIGTNVRSTKEENDITYDFRFK